MQYLSSKQQVLFMKILFSWSNIQLYSVGTWKNSSTNLNELFQDEMEEKSKTN